MLFCMQITHKKQNAHIAGRHSTFVGPTMFLMLDHRVHLTLGQRQKPFEQFEKILKSGMVTILVKFNIYVFIIYNALDMNF